MHVVNFMSITVNFVVGETCIFFAGTNITAYSNAYFGESSGPYHLDELGCGGYETNLTACSRGYSSGGEHNNGIGVHNCAPGNEAGVKCDGRWTVVFGLTSLLSFNNVAEVHIVQDISIRGSSSAVRIQY